jgi:hypothetical protein
LVLDFESDLNPCSAAARWLLFCAYDCTTPVAWLLCLVHGCAVVLQIESACVLIWFRLCYGVEWCAMASFVLVGSWLFGTALVWVRELLAVDLCYDKLF